jgi:hypothetical protein
LLGYREASKEVLGDYHELFSDESYKISQCFLLSTSQVNVVIVIKNNETYCDMHLIKMKNKNYALLIPQYLIMFFALIYEAQ